MQLTMQSQWSWQHVIAIPFRAIQIILYTRAEQYIQPVGKDIDAFCIFVSTTKLHFVDYNLQPLVMHVLMWSLTRCVCVCVIPLRTTCPAIIMEVENYPKWKETYINIGSIFINFPPPWLWEEEYQSPFSQYMALTSHDRRSGGEASPASQIARIARPFWSWNLCRLLLAAFFAADM